MGMSLCVLGMAKEFEGKIGFNALWPRTAIATSAVEFYLGDKSSMKKTRVPRIMSDSLVYILRSDNKHCSGNFF